MSGHCGLVVHEAGGGFVKEALRFGPLRVDEVAVLVVASGLCHTDLMARGGAIPVRMPIILGHEGAGVVMDRGEGVTSIDIGDHVVMSFVSCGTCDACLCGHPASCGNFGALNFSGARADGTHAIELASGECVSDQFFGQSSFATVAICRERNLVKVRKDAPLSLLGPLGCGIQTGAGAVLNSFAIEAGASLAVFGAGAVGLSAVMAAVVAGVTSIIAVDRVESRLSLARELGATHAINATMCDAVMGIRDIVPSGVAYALDTTGVPQVIRQAIDVLQPRGTCGLVGASVRGTEVPLDVNDLMKNCKTVIGIIEGDSVPAVFIPRLIDLYMQGRFPIDKLVRFYPFDQIEAAATASVDGSVVKPILLMPTYDLPAA